MTSTRSLKKDLQAKLKGALGKRLKGTITLELSVDAELLAGVVVEYGNKIIDGCALTQLQEMRNRLVTVEE